MLPFAFLGTRAEDAAADGEYAATLACTGLAERDLTRFRVEREPLPTLDLAAWSGIILGGGPFNVSDPHAEKSDTQRRAEVELRDLATRCVESDFPFLGCCYGVGTLGVLNGGVVDREHGEPVGPVAVRLTDDGVSDQLFGVLPREFNALVGHKEAVSRLPDGAALLASGESCPVQAFRLGRNVYATQFHPELDADGLVERLRAYAGYGYDAPVEGAELFEIARAAQVDQPQRLLARFVDLFAR